MRANQNPEGEHVKLWAAWLSQTFSTRSFRVFDVDQLSVFVELRGSAEHARLAQGLRTAVQRESLSLFPLHCPECAAHISGHWALLAVEPQRVRYYETLDEPNEICAQRARWLLEALGRDIELARTNAFKQSADHCAWWLLHYLELEVRHLDGQGWAACSAVTSVRRSAMKDFLRRSGRSLEEARMKFLQEARIENAKVQALRKALLKKKGLELDLEQRLQGLTRQAEAAVLLSRTPKT